jgi:hypothetical protein
MHYFLRALRDAAKSWPLLLAAFLCSAGVAALWGANIAALFPIIEVTLNGESLQTWNTRRIDETDAKIEAFRSEIDGRPQSNRYARDGKHPRAGGALFREETRSLAPVSASPRL